MLDDSLVVLTCLSFGLLHVLGPYASIQAQQGLKS